MDKMTKFQDEKTKPLQEEEEMLEFKITNSGEPPELKTQDYKRRSSSEPSDFFEFFTGFSSDETMSSADDIIFRGKLVPYNCKDHQQPHHRTHHHQILKSLSADDANYTDKRFRRNSTTPVMMKSEAASDIHRSSSKSSAKSEGSKLISKPRWWFVLMMFGPLKLQQEMDLRDMKNRQVRRNIPVSIFTGIDAGGKVPAMGNERRRSSWGHDLIKVLSCKNHASVAVSASIITNHNIHI